THATLIGCGAFSIGDVGIVAGSTMPIQMVVDRAIIDPNQQIWAGVFSIPEHWVIESNAGPTGSVYSWFLDTFLRKTKEAERHAEFEELVYSQPPGAGEVYADLGTHIMDAPNYTQLPQTRFIFPPVSYGIGSKVTLGSFARATIENLAYAVRANVEQIQNVANRSAKKFFLVGGLSRSRTFTQILADILNTPIYVTVPEGCALAGFAAAKHASEEITYEEAVSQIINPKQVTSPNEEVLAQYESNFIRWKEIYAESRVDR
ncbi:MAG: FGGY-family carbohydrate kinase, partial [Candidatus Hodarchaeota archaeon]